MEPDDWTAERMVSDFFAAVRPPWVSEPIHDDPRPGESMASTLPLASPGREGSPIDRRSGSQASQSISKTDAA